VLIAIAATLTLSTPVAGQSDVSVDGLSVPDVNETAEGDVSDVRLSADIQHSHSIPDAQERIVKLRAGPSESELQTLTFDRAENVGADESATVTLSGSLLDAGFTAEEFNPDLAGSTEQTVVVEAVVEITRENGETVTRTARDTVTVTVRDGAELTASVGGDGTITIETAE
jgi:hypothetical protein